MIAFGRFMTVACVALFAWMIATGAWLPAISVGISALVFTANVHMLKETR